MIGEHNRGSAILFESRTAKSPISAPGGNCACWKVELMMMMCASMIQRATLGGVPQAEDSVIPGVSMGRGLTVPQAGVDLSWEIKRKMSERITGPSKWASAALRTGSC